MPSRLCPGTDGNVRVPPPFLPLTFRDTPAEGQPMQPEFVLHGLGWLTLQAIAAEERANAERQAREQVEEEIDHLRLERAGNAALIHEMKSHLSRHEPDNPRWW